MAAREVVEKSACTGSWMSRSGPLVFSGGQCVLLLIRHNWHAASVMANQPALANAMPLGGRYVAAGQGASRRPTVRTAPTRLDCCRRCRKEIFAPAKIGVPTPRFRSGAQPAQDAESGRATREWTGVQPETIDCREAHQTARQSRVARPLTLPTGKVSGGGRGIGSGCGRPARKTACHPSDQRAAVPLGNDGLSVCLYRLHACDGLQDGRRSRGTRLFSKFAIAKGRNGLTAKKTDCGP